MRLEPGLDIAPADFDEHFVEEQVPHSTALHARLRDGAAPTSSARWPATRSTGTASASARARRPPQAGLGAVVPQPVPSIVVRASSAPRASTRRSR